MADRDLTAPPPRYRVEERGGKLVVIDGGAPGPGMRISSSAPSAPARRGKSFEKIAFDGRGVLTTRAFYDQKGPRRLAVGPDIGMLARWLPVAWLLALLGAGVLALFAPWALVAVPVLAQPKLWRRQRARITAWLDRFPAAT